MSSFTFVKRVGELLALSGVVLTPRLRHDFMLSVSFLVKIERVVRLLLRSFSLKSIRVLVGDLNLHLSWSCSLIAHFLEGLGVVCLGVLACWCPQAILFAPFLRTLFPLFLRGVVFGTGIFSGVGVPPLRVLSIRDMSSFLSSYLF